MKDKLVKKLKQDDRNLTWFWKKYITLEKMTYPTFFTQLSGNARIRDDIKKIVEDFIK